MSFNNLGELALEHHDYTEARTLFEESLALKREIGDKRGVISSLFNLGLVAAEQQAYAPAQTYHLESLTLAREIGEKLYIVYNLTGLGAVALGVGASRQMVVFAAAAAAILTSIKGTLVPFVQGRHEARLAAARASIGDDEFAAAWAEGITLTLESVVTYALAQPLIK